jgi:hypothetical protein
MASFVKVLGYNASTRNYNNLSCDSNGMLNVNVVSGGGGGGAGDASAANQLTQIQIAEDSNAAIYSQLEVQTDRLLFDLDVIANRLHDIEGNVIVTNQITGYATSQLQESSNIAQWTKLNLIEQGTEINAGYLQAIDTHLTPLQQGVGRYDLSARTTLSPDTVPAYSAPPSGIPASEGWYYKNTSAGNVSQLYYYANQSSQTRNHDYTISSIQSQWAVVRLLNLNSGTSLPFLVVYSQPEGSGDILPGFARSSWVYQVATGQELRLGEKVLIYRGIEPDSRIYPELRRVECTLTVTRGPALTSELLAYATLNSDSGAPVNTVEYVVGGAGLSFLGDHVYKVELTAESAAVAGDASSANQVSSNTAICSRLDEQNTLSNSIVQILSDTVAVINYGIVTDSPPTYIPIKASNTGNLFVYDTQTHSELLTLNAEIDGVIDDTAGALKVVGDFYLPVQPVEFETPQSVNLYSGGAALTYTQTGASQYSLDVHVNNSTDIPVSGLFFQETQPVSIEKLSFTAGDELIVYDDYSFQELQSLNGKVVLCDTGNVVISGTVPISSASALSVTETNPITDYATETTSALIKAQTDKLSFYADVGAFDLRTQVMNEIGVSVNNTPTVSLSSGTEVSLISGTQVGLSSGAQVQLVSSEVSLVSGTTVGLSAGTSVDTNITNASIPITSASTLDTNITNTSLDVHGYASSDGTTWHHLKSDPTGHLIVHSETRDGNNNRITSDTFGLGGASRGIHTIIGNTSLAVTGSVTASANQYGSYANVANNITLASSSFTAGVNVSDWSYFIGYYEDTTPVTPVGQIRVQYSFDNVTYYNLFNTQIFASGTPRTATINKTDIPGINYLRLSNNTTSSLTGVVFTVMGGSLS